MSTQAYYKDRLGFDPHDDPKENSNDPILFGYEENLSKFKDERDAIQKKTFTKWVNKHLKKAGRRVNDLFEDLRDGNHLISLLEVLSGEKLPRERGKMRFHMLQNVQIALDFLRYRKIKLVNIRAEDIVDGNPKLTLGLIWTIILHFQISDIVEGDTSISAREALLRWAKRTTDKYPGVRVADFTGSWRDGLAFNAIIHRNRPDLVDYRAIRTHSVRNRLETAFDIMDREYNVTRLLDPEDVDTPEPDEKSLITYISCLYDVFPEPPIFHPLFDTDSQRRLEEYRDYASSLHLWIKEHISIMLDRNFPSTLIEMRKLLNENNRFHVEDVPPRLRDKQKITHIYHEIENYLREASITLGSEISLANIERDWQTLMKAHQDRDNGIQDEINRLERLQRIAEKIHREAKQMDTRLDDIEDRIIEESKRIDRLHPSDAKHNCDQLEDELLMAEDAIKAMFNDVQVLKDGRYNQSADLHRRVQQLHDRWASIRMELQNGLISVLMMKSSHHLEERIITKETRVTLDSQLLDTNEHFQFMQECISWVREKLLSLNERDYGSDLPTVQNELESHQKEHKIIDKFQTNVEQCIQAKLYFQGEENRLYVQILGTLQKTYAELLSLSNKRLSDLDSLLDFIQAATNELIWLNEKEETEVMRDWSAKNLNISEIEHYYENLMSELEKREMQFNHVQDRGETLITQHHPATKCVEAYMAAMQTQWSWLLQLTLCLETHLKHATAYHEFFKDAREAEQTIMRQDELLNTIYSKSEFSLDEGERLLREMQDLRDELTQFNEIVQSLIDRSKDILPLKQRRQPVAKPTPVIPICQYKHVDMKIQKDERCTLHDNSQKLKWEVTNSIGTRGMVPGVCFLIPPPNQEAIDTAEKLKRQYDRSIALWQKKQLRMRQNMIFATIRVVKSWDLQQFMSMGKEQRNTIRRALNEDAEKLMQEGDPSDPQLKRLEREIAEVNRLFDEFERRAAKGDEKSPERVFTDQINSLQSALDEAERTLAARTKAPVPRDLDTLEQMVIEHKEFETKLQSYEPQVEAVQKTFKTLQKKGQYQSKLDKCIEKWDHLWSVSHIYIERLKCVEIVLTGLEDATNVVSEFELKLASYSTMPSDMNSLQEVHEDLISLQNSINQQQSILDQLNDDVRNVRDQVEKSRPGVRRHPDVDRLEDDINKLANRWKNLGDHVVERLRSCEAASELLRLYQDGLDKEKRWLEEQEAKLRMDKQAMQEKYRHCEETVTNLLDWIAEIERRLSNQQPVQEDAGELRNQINTVKQIHDDLGDHMRTVNNCLDQVRHIVDQGGEYLSSSEISHIQKYGDEVKKRYDRCVDQSDKLLKRLTAALEELNKFRSDMGTFKTWMDRAFRTLTEKERLLANLDRIQSSKESVREFVSDVISHQADLRFITISAQKFIDEAKEEFTILNQFQTSQQERYRHREFPDYELKHEVDDVTRAYQDLLARTNRLTDKVNSVGNKQNEYREAVERARSWMKEVEPRAQKIIKEPVAAEPSMVKEQLDRAKALNNDVLAHARIIENAKETAAALLTALGDDIPPAERATISEVPNELDGRYKVITAQLAECCQVLDTALVQSQGVQDALDSFSSWLSNAEEELKEISKPASLNRDRLMEQIQEYKILQADIDHHKPSIDSINRSAQQLLQTASNARIAKKIETKLKEVNTRYDKLCERAGQRGAMLDEIHSSLEYFNLAVDKFEDWYVELVEVLESQEIIKLELDAYSAKIDEVARRRDMKQKEFDDMITTGKNLVGRREVTDTNPIKEKLKDLEGQWKDLNAALSDRQQQGRSRSEQLSMYEKLRQQVMQWLGHMEERFDDLEPVAIDFELIKRQIEELKPLAKEHREYSSTIDKVNEMGIAYETMMRSEPGDTGSMRRRSSASPKRPSISSMKKYSLRKPSSDSRSPSLHKLSLTGSLLVNGAGGYSSRRSSTESYIEDITPIQMQLSEINNRYEMLGMRMHDRQSELDTVRDDIKHHSDNLRSLNSFLDKVERQLPKDTIPMTKEEADKQLKVVRECLNDLYEKQPNLDSLRNAVKDLLKKRPNAPGADTLQGEVNFVTDRWHQLQDLCKDKTRFLEESKMFHDSYEGLIGWLAAKEKMMSVLGPIPSDPRVVQTQQQQVLVIRDEFGAQYPQVRSLNQSGSKLLDQSDPRSSDSKKVQERMDNVSQRWENLLAMLDEREQALAAASGASKDFSGMINKLQDSLQKIGDEFEDLCATRMGPEDQLKKLGVLENQLEGQRPLLTEVEGSCEQLCEILTDPASKADLKNRVGQVTRTYNQLQKKLDNRRAELEGALRAGQEFDNSCEDMQDWLKDHMDFLAAEPLRVSADWEILKQQISDFEPYYREVMNKEHEVVMLLNKGTDIIQDLSSRRGADVRTQQKNLDKIKLEWERLKKDTVDRHTRLHTCHEHCRKFHTAQEKFLPWLNKAEQKLFSLSPVSFKAGELDRQLKEIQMFRSDVSQHSAEYESNHTLGDTLIAATDTDKEYVKDDLKNMKLRWERLNSGIAERAHQLEDTGKKLSDFNDKLHDVQHSLQRCEDRLASQDALGDAGRDPKMLGRVKALLEDALAVEKPLDSLRRTADALVKVADSQGGDASHIQDAVENLADRLQDLKQKLEDRCNELESASQFVGDFNAQIKSINHDLSSLEEQLSSMKPVGREIKVVGRQTDEVEAFIRQLHSKHDSIDHAASMCDELLSSGYTSDAKGLREQLDNLTRQLSRLDNRAKTREDECKSTLSRLESFYEHYNVVMSDLDELTQEERRFKPVSGDVESIRNQQEEFRNFKERSTEMVGEQVNECNKSGQGLIQSAAPSVSTTTLENDLEKMNEKWNSMKQKLQERERKLDIGLLQSGKFQEALEGLLKWLSDTEEMVANQKPPSADFKVVKAQLAEQKFLQKMLLDRQGSVSSVMQMGEEVASNMDPSERRNIESQLKDMVERFDNLNAVAEERHRALEEAMKVAKEFQDRLTPIVAWLEKQEKHLKDMETVPTDEDKIQKRIREHQKLHDDILAHRPHFDDLADIATALMSLVSDEEAQYVADKLQDVTDRYGALVEASENLAHVLQESKDGLRHLVLSYQDLLAWMEEMEQRLGRYKILSVFVEKLLDQMEELTEVTEEVANHQKQVDQMMDAGLELMKHISSDEAIQLKDKLDSINRKYGDLTSKAADLLRHAQETLPLVQQFHTSHDKLSEWLIGVEGDLQSMDASMGLQEHQINRLEAEIADYKPVLETVNLVGPQLCQISPGEGASTVEGLVTRDNRRFDAIVEELQRRAERMRMSKQRSMEVAGDIDELLDWFREVEGQIRDAEPPSAEPEVIRMQLKEHKALNDDISSQKGRVRDVLSSAKKVIRAASQQEDTALIREKMDDLKEIMEIVSKLSSDRLSDLEQALPLAEHFFETHIDITRWLDEMENNAMAIMDTPALNADQIIKQQERNKGMLQSITEHKPLIDKLNKTGSALARLTSPEDSNKVEELMDSDNQRYNALKAALRERQQALEEALQESSKFTDKLDGMLSALNNTADQVQNAEPISAHTDKLHDQINDNAGIVEDLDKRSMAYEAVKQAAEDVISKATNKADPAVRDIKKKLDKLNKLWDSIQDATKNRGDKLDDALTLAEKFWEELEAVMQTLHDLQSTLQSQEPPAVEPKEIKEQQQALQNIKAEIDNTKPEVEQCRQTGQELMTICGEPDKPEVKKQIEDLDNAWDNITALFAKREENLIDAMEKAMEFHDTLQSLLDFLDKAEVKFDNLGPVATDIEAVKSQIEQLKRFKSTVDPQMVKVEALNRQAQELTERTSPDQAAQIKKPLSEVNRRWDELLKGIVDRQRDLEHALLKLGQFQHALSELLVWIDRTEKTLDDLKPVFGDPQVIEVELAKLKVSINDIQAHQTSVDTLNDAGRQIIESDKGSDDASTTQKKLNELNKKWNGLLEKAGNRQKELEDALKEAQDFSAEIQDLLMWLSDIDGAISTTKAVGGLPETASEQLNRFMEVYNELDENRPKVEAILQQGEQYLKKSTTGSASNLQHNLKQLKQRWDNVLSRANDKKIKLEIALKEATEFHEALQEFVDWLTNAEKVLSNLSPVSRVMDTILQQIEEHKAFQKDVGSHRDVMLNLDKKGTHLKYFSQKQDVILIKNLLISVQHRWERVVSKSAERTRALDLGYKEAKEFHDSWTELMNWLVDVEKGLDEIADHIRNDPEKIKEQLAKHKDFQRQLGAKQPNYDSIMKLGKSLKDKAPRHDEPVLKQMLSELKNKWNSVCSKSVDRQRKLEEALLFSGQFKEALQALLDWLKKVDTSLGEDGPVHGDLDTVTALVEKHKNFEEELANREAQVESVKTTASDLLKSASREDAASISTQVRELTTSWEKVWSHANNRSKRLEGALKLAEELHMSVNALLNWLSDAEMKLRFVGPLPEDEELTESQINEHQKFLVELRDKEKDKDAAINLAKDILSKAHPDAVSVIKHWITLIQSRWDDVSSWAHQRDQRLQEHLKNLRDMASLLDELMEWLKRRENTLTDLESKPLPDEVEVIEGLIKDHNEFMEDMAKKQPDIDTVCKPKTTRQSHPPSRRTSKAKGSTPSRESLSPDRGSTPSYDRRISRTSPDRDESPESRRRSSQSPPREVSPTRDYPKPWMSGARTSPGREHDNLDLEQMPHIGPRFPAPQQPSRRGSKVIPPEPQIKNPRAKALWDKWRHVWMMAWERQRRLYDKLNYLRELEKVKNFSWDEWRKRFLKYMNNKKSRVTDLFRKVPNSHHGIIPREDFIDAIMRTKFPTSRLEMNAVADMFDRDGWIDYNEFIAALRPDWMLRKQPLTDDERIDDEIQRQVQQCTCRTKFKVHQVGEGKYRFGDSQKLRLVRILRSTVMVRVGGGWVALDEFLVKNDPCRAKGRTNVDLREQFVLPPGASQSMASFKTKASPNSSMSSPSPRTSTSLPTAGPIVKVRERTPKSLPMQSRSSVSSQGHENSLDASDGSFRLTTPRKGSAPARSSLSVPRHSSTPGSRSSSRHGSNQSLDSIEDHSGSKIPRRTSSIKRGSSRTSTPGRHTPSASGTTTPTGPRSSTGTRLTRKSSGASDTPTGSARKSTTADRPRWK